MRRNVRKTISLHLAAVSIALALAACAPPGVVRAARPVLDEPPLASSFPRASALATHVGLQGCRFDEVAASIEGSALLVAAVLRTDLRGDPGFSPDQLSPEARCWYEELWGLIDDPGKSAEFTGWAASNDLYVYARTLNTHVNALLLAFRLTGDLNLLDEVARLAQHMRAALDDSWHGAAALESRSVDGYLNWVWSENTRDVHYGRDLHVTDEMRTHALVAQIAWALSNNADLPSPNGVDYGERASFWISYLRDHFEAKWRARESVPWPRMPFVSRPHMHETVDFVRYHHYLYLLTGEDAYRREADRLTALVFDNLRVASSSAGPALITPRSILSLGGSEEYLLPSTYVRYIFSDAVDLYFEGVGAWSDDTVLERFARTLSEFMLDGRGEGVARDMGGGVERAGVPASSERDWSRVTRYQFSNSAYAFLTAWEEGDKIATAALELYTGSSVRDRGVFVPVAMLLDSALRSD